MDVSATAAAPGFEKPQHDLHGLLVLKQPKLCLLLIEKILLISQRDCLSLPPSRRQELTSSRGAMAGSPLGGGSSLPRRGSSGEHRARS